MRRIFPVPVALNRLKAERLVFIFGIFYLAVSGKSERRTLLSAPNTVKVAKAGPKGRPHLVQDRHGRI